MSRLDDIAKVAGVSRHTVARILNGKRQEKWPSKQEQGDRIRRLAEEMGYRPNASARALVLGRFNCIGLIHSTKDAQSYLSPAMLSGIDEGLVKHDLHLTMARLDDSKLTDPSFVPKILREWLCDGLIINYHGVPQKMKKLLTDFRIPAVWLNCKQDTDAVYSDDETAAVESVEYLVKQGHKRIAYADSSFFLTKRSGHQHHSRTDRKSSSDSAVRKAGLTAVHLHDNEKKADGQFIENVGELLSSKRRPTAVVAYSIGDMQALRVIAAEKGLKVPDDISIIGFAGEDELGSNLWDDTVMVISEREMCVEAVEMVSEKIARPQVEIPARKQKFSLHKGASVSNCSS